MDKIKETSPESKIYILDPDVLMNAQYVADNDLICEWLRRDGIDTFITWYDPIIGADVFKFPKKPTDRIILGVRLVEIV